MFSPALTSLLCSLLLSPTWDILISPVTIWVEEYQSGLEIYTSSLVSLDLSSNAHFKVDNLDWFFNISSLRCFNMSFVNLSKTENWLQVTNMLPSLEYFSLTAAVSLIWWLLFQLLFQILTSIIQLHFHTLISVVTKSPPWYFLGC